MKPSIVFLSPVIPSFSGNGLAMRAAHNLRALSGKFSVHLLVIAIYYGQGDRPLEDVLRCCASWKWIDGSLPTKANFYRDLRHWIRWGKGEMPTAWKRWRPENEQKAQTYFAETQCVRLWVFRFYMLPWVKTWLDKGKKVWLDLDELESSARGRHADLFFSLGQHEEARHLKREAQLYRDLERCFLPRFERIMTASEVETTRLQDTMGHLPAETWPNIVSPPAVGNQTADNVRAEWRLLFIGSMGHFPNREAIRYAAQEVLPRLQMLVGRRVVLQVAGAGADAHQAAFADLNQVEWLGTVPDVTPVYAASDLVIVPLHSGGGTRIKILEAFAHQKAVISTRIGAEGLKVVQDRELLLADTPDEMAAGCAELLLNAEKRDRLVGAGYDYVTAHHGEEILNIRAAALGQDLTPLAEEQQDPRS